MMRLLFDDLARKPRRHGRRPPTELAAGLLGRCGPGDVVMIKGSLGSRMAPLVEAMLARFGTGPRR